MSAASKCKHVRADGTSCQASSTPSGYCWFHDPARERERAEARRKGRREKNKRSGPILALTAGGPIALKTVADVLQLLSTTATDVRMGNVDSKIGNCLTYISTAALKAITGADFEERLQALEKLAQQQQRRA
jgi:hypothetical protein